MTNSPHAARPAAPSRVGVPTSALDPSQAAGLSRFAAEATRKVEVKALGADGSRTFLQHTVPTLPLFEAAFSAFARGTLLQSPAGYIAIEDLHPGCMLRTVAGRNARVMWIGMTDFAPEDRGPGRLVRIMPDSFGEARPDRFLTLGSGARILQTPPHLRAEAGHTGVLTPVRAFIDMVNVIEVTPPSPVTLYHVTLDRHATIRADGLECETFHPGACALSDASRAMQDRFLSLFPQIDHVVDFGPLAHRHAPECPDAVTAAA